jgi:outer membrane protein TolC
MKPTKMFVLVLLFFPLLIQAQQAESITALFDSLKTHPKAIADNLVLEKALAGKKMATGNLFPKIDAFGTYDYTTSPTGMLPVAPNELLAMVKDQSIAQPFSQNILRVGASVSMPVFVKSIYTMSSKAKTMYRSAEAMKYINLLKNEAMIVSLNANLKFMNEMIDALNKKRQSILKTREIITIKVNNDRAPKSALLKINDALNQIDLAIAGIKINKSQASSMIQSLTGIYLENDIPMVQTGSYVDSGLVALEPLRFKIDAERLGLRAEKEKLLPMLVARGNYNHSMANAYNNDGRVNKDYTTVGLVLKVPIFNKSQYAKITKTNLEVRELENTLADKELELSTEARQQQNNLKIIENTIKLYEQSIKDKEELLKVAKVAYSNDRMTIEDYLKYEDDFVLEKSKYYKAIAEKWQTLMKLAVIYGNDIEQIVK